MQQVAVRRMNLNEIEARLESPARCLAKALDNGLDSGFIERGGHRVIRRKGDRAGRDRLPSALGRSYRRRPLLKGRGRARLAPGVRQLHAGARALRMDELRDAAEIGNVLVFPDAKIGRRDAAFRQYGRSLKHDQAGSALRAAAQVNKVPVVGKAVVARVLAHGRNADAVAELNGAKLKGRKKRSCHI